LELLATEARVRSLLIVGTPPVRLCEEALHEAFYADDDMQLAARLSSPTADALTYGTAMMGGRRHLAGPLLRNIRRTDGKCAEIHVRERAEGSRGRRTRHRRAVAQAGLRGAWRTEPFVRLNYLRSLSYGALWNKAGVRHQGSGARAPLAAPRRIQQILAYFLH